MCVHFFVSLFTDELRTVALTLLFDANSDKYGRHKVEVELGKKERREGDVKEIPLSQFLKIYEAADVYMVDDATESMKGDFAHIFFLEKNKKRLISFERDREPDRRKVYEYVSF